MKKLVIVLIFVALALPVFAQPQTSNQHTDMYCFNVPVERIYPSSYGYIIQYRRNTNEIGSIGIPNEWFSDAAGRGEMIKLPPGKDWPTMSIFYYKGEFSHVRVYVHPVKSHTTWGNVPQGTDVSRFFSEDPDAFDFKH